MGRLSVRLEEGELVVARRPAEPGRSSYLRGTVRAGAAVATAAALCWAVLQIPYTGDTGPAIDRGLFCIALELLGAGVGAAVATAGDPNRDVSVGIVGGFVAHAAVWALLIVPDFNELAASVLVFMLLAGALMVGIGAFAGRAVALRPRSPRR
ncbi:MAG: hypothetical protein M3217_07985 [Actinomycetota bacterium]|nr:hypothetical protein [Actinomycetota bacterium]